MASIDDDQLNKNSFLFISVREKRNVDEKIVNIRKYLEEGADVNAADGNNNNNTALHIAVQRSEAGIVRLLINNGASKNAKNSKGETPLKIAQELNTDSQQEIVSLLQAVDESANNKPADDIAYKVLHDNAQPRFEYLKRTGTSGVCGQLYETKLLSLILLRALNDDDIELFHLGTNISGIGDLDDICLRYQLKGNSQPIMVFVQAKHREDREKGRLTLEDVQSASGDFSLRKYFESYLTIKDRFQPKNADVMFEGEFGSVECNLIIYTPAKESFTKKKTEKQVSEKVHYLINTGKNTEVFQLDHKDEDNIDFLTKMTVLERIKKLGSIFLTKMYETQKNAGAEVMMTDLIARYHVVIGREVLQLSKIQQESKVHRVWKFRPDFFTSDCEYLVTLKETFYKQLSTTRCDKSGIVDQDKENLEMILENPCASTISQLIGKILTYNEKTKKLQLIELKDLKKKFEANKFKLLLERFNNVEIHDNIIREAIRIKLESIELKLPLAFGNLDMTLRGNETKAKRRVETLADKLINLFQQKNTETIEITDEIVGPGKILEQGIIDINGGIGGAVGNLLVFDAETKTMKFDLENEALPSNAALLLKELKHERHNPFNKELSRYRIKININGFPKDSFHGDEYDKRQAREFLSRLWFYPNQAKEDEVECILKNDINRHYNNDNGQNQFKFKIHSDAIFLRSHDAIQKWWMKTGKAPYLNRTSEFFEQAKLAVIDDPLLTVLNFMYNLKIQNIGIKFTQDAIDALELGKCTEKLFNVVTEANVLSGIKIMQHYETQDKYTFIDFDYVLSLPLKDYNKMRHELTQTNIETLIIIYEKLKYYEGLCNKLKEVIKLFNGSKVVVVTDSILADEIKEHVGDKYRSVTDYKTYMIDLTESSQAKISEEATIVFQGEELPFKSVLYGTARNLVRTEILYKLIYREKIEIGHALMDQIYKDVNHFIERSLSKDETFVVNTLNDVDDEVVIIVGRPGIGRSTLLTHLSLNTKIVNSLPWIVRINLQNYEKEFTRWQEKDITIDEALILHFLCTIALKNTDTHMKIKLDHREGKAIVSYVDENVDPLALFELEFFLYLYNSGQVIFLFDDFNAMVPHYQKEVFEILQLLNSERKRMWVTTYSYKHTREALENVFGNSYKLNPFHAKEKKIFLERFFRTNLRLEKLNYDQFENVRSFMKFMSKVTNMRLISEPHREFLPLFSLTFHWIYIMAVKFFQSEINRASASTVRDKVREKFEIDLDQYTPVDELLGRTPDDEELELAGTPLHLYIAANYFKFRIEDSLSFSLSEEEVRNKWDLIVNTFTLYRHYVEAHMKRIFCKEDRDNESVRATYQHSRKEFLEKHKKLGLFTICRENDLSKFLKPDEISEIQSTISKMERGEDRSSLVSCVVNKVPRFAHLVFAEYFAVEYLTDMMKSIAEDSEQNPLKKASLWQFILNILLFKAPPGVRKAFDYKLQNDHALAKLANSQSCREVVFELLLKQDRQANTRDGERGTHNTSVTAALYDGLTNIVNLFLSSAQLNLNRGNVDEFLNLLRHSGEKFADFGKEYAETLTNVFDSVKDMDVGKLGDILKSGRLTEVPLRHASSFCQSEAASELQRQVATTSTQLPVHVEQLIQQTGTIRETLTSLTRLGVKTILDDVLTRLKPPDPDLD